MEFRTRHTTWNTWHTWKTWKTQQTRKSWSKYNISHVNTCSMCVLIRINHSTIHNFQLFVWLLPPIWKFLLIPHHSEIQYATPNNMLDNIVQFPFVLAYSNNSHPLNKLILITYPKPRNANDIHAATNNMKHMKIIANAQNRKHLKTTNVNAHPFFFFWLYTIQPYINDEHGWWLLNINFITHLKIYVEFERHPTICLSHSNTLDHLFLICL